MLLQILATCPDPRVAGVEDVLAHDLQIRRGRLQVGGRAADDEGQGARRRSARAARHRRIQHADAVFRRRFRHFAGRFGSDGAAFQHQGVPGDGLQKAVFPQIQAFDVAAGRQHGDDKIHARHRLGRRGDCRGAGLGGGLQGRRH
jgi:hypothetical protein